MYVQRTFAVLTFRAISGLNRLLPARCKFSAGQHSAGIAKTLLRSAVCLAALLQLCAATVIAQEDQSETQLEESALDVPRAHLVSVSMPIRGSVDTNVKQAIDSIARDQPSGGPRSILILEFRSAEGEAAEASEFERSFSLARYLASDRLSAWRTIAFLPEGALGHAVLPVLACEEIIMGADAELGEAGIQEQHVDQSIRLSYEETSRRRRTVPSAVALGMLDAQLEIVRAQTSGGAVYLQAGELDQLRESTTISSVETIIPPDDFGKFSGSDLRLKFGFVSHLASDRNELAAVLKIPATAITDDRFAAVLWQPMAVDVKGPINQKTVNWILRTVDERASANEINLLFVRITSPGGSAQASIQLADFLASLESRSIRTVAFVAREARADAAIVALACDQVVMAPEARLGGPGAATIRSRDLPDLQRAIRAIAETKHRDWSLPVALVDNKTQVTRYERVGTGQKRYLSDSAFQELEAQDDWQRQAAIDVSEGFSGREARDFELVHALADDFQAVLASYHLETDVQSIEPNWAHLLIERLASPRLAGVLLFIALFTLILEFSQPGLGVPGFASAVCFVLYFWSQHLHGTAGWLEVLLFTVGVASIVVEIFVVPGLGIFGLGGAALVVTSIVLASQTFVVPVNSYQMEQVPRSLGIVVAAATGALVSMLLVRRYLPDAPLFRRMLLSAPDDEQIEELSRRESIVDFAHLSGKRGRTTTQLTPSGKARFGDEVVNVISDGDVIPVHTDIMVAEVRGNRISVRRIGAQQQSAPHSTFED